MAIRFRCVSCTQPIEVDDEWKLKLVACPYCRRTVTAPSESILDDFTEIPTAKPLLEPAPRVEWPAVPPPNVMAYDRNAPAVVALILCGVAMTLFLTASLISAAHTQEITAVQEALREGGSWVSAVNKLAERHGGAMPGWLMAIGFLQVTSIGAMLAAVVCGILGLRRSWRRGMAIASLVVSGAFLAFLCLGMVAGLAA